MTIPFEQSVRNVVRWAMEKPRLYGWAVVTWGPFLDEAIERGWLVAEPTGIMHFRWVAATDAGHAAISIQNAQIPINNPALCKTQV